MPDVFISYSSKDAVVARQLHTVLSLAGVTPFLAEVDLPPGVKWKEKILDNIRNAKWVFFLATPNSCASQPVAHEIGASLVLRKRFIPIMWKVAPSDLPAWVDDTQPLTSETLNGSQRSFSESARKLSQTSSGLACS